MAEPLYRRAAETRHIALGEKHPDYAASLHGLAVVCKSKGDLAAAEPLLRRALELRRAALGEEHPDYATSLSSLGLLYHEKKDFASAEPLLRRAVEVRRVALGEEHLDYATSLSNLAVMYDAKGDLAAAEPLYRRAAEIRRLALGEEHPQYATTLSNLGTLYGDKGDLAAAEPLLRRAAELRRTALGEEHPDYAASLHNLALLYNAKGDFAAAEPLYRRAVEVLLAAVGDRHPDYAASLSNLAAFYFVKGDLASAVPLLQRAVELSSRARGEEDPAYAASLHNLAALYKAQGDYAKAEALFRRALEITREALGEQNASFARVMNGLAALYDDKGDFAAAEPLYVRAVEVFRAAVGELHVDYAMSLNNLSLLYAATERDDQAMSLMDRAAAIDDRMIGQVFSVSSESQRAAFLATVQGKLDAFLSLVYRRPQAAAVVAAMKLVLRRKGIRAEAAAALRDAVLGGRHPAMRPKLHELASLRRLIAKESLSGPGPDGAESHARRLDGWEAERGRLEAELAAGVPQVNLERQLGAADCRAIALAMPAGAALIEFVRFDQFDFRAIPGRGEPKWKPARYVAFVLHAERPDDVRMVDLGNADAIDRLIAAFREAIISGGRRQRDVEGEVDEPVEAPTESVGLELLARVFAPLRQELRGCNQLLLAPDGDLARLPFEVLPSGKGESRLIDEYRIGYLATGRDVLRIGAAHTGEPTAPLVVADPDFNLATGGPAAPDESSALRGRLSRDLDRGRYHFSRLPGTLAEGECVAGMLGVRPWLNAGALEARLKTCRSPRILHLATHGFFLENQKHDPNREAGGFGLFGTEGPTGRLTGPLPENPLLRSGLGLAGVNTWLAGGSPPAEAEDGILTAEDVTGLDLLDTELVVLSACETGLGEVRVGEGVFGLRRAFVLAGARTLVMSLWKVPDEQTRELMEEFYRRLLAGAPRADALREAQLAIRAKHPHPYFWGAFICQGDLGPLSKT